MRKTKYHPIRGLPGKTEAKKSASMFMGKYAHSADNQQKLLVQPLTVMKYPTKKLPNSPACSYSFLSPFDKNATPFP
jgi:hypothetical protein